MHARTFTYHRMLQIHFVPQPLVFLFEPLQVTRIFQHGGGDRRYDHTCAGGPRRSRKLPLPTEERASFWLTTALLESAKPSRSTRSVICLHMCSDGDPWSLFQASSGGSEPPVSSVSTIAPRSAGITSRISSNSARTGKELSREAKVRLEWMDFCRRTQNVARTCRHFGYQSPDFLPLAAPL